MRAHTQTRTNTYLYTTHKHAHTHVRTFAVCGDERASGPVADVAAEMGAETFSPLLTGVLLVFGALILIQKRQK